MALTWSVSTNVFMDSNTPMLLTTDMTMWSTGGPIGTQVPMNVGPARPQIRWDRGGEPDSIRDKSIFTREEDED